MRGVVFRGNRHLETLNFPDPTPGPGQVVVQMKASGMCGTDLHFYRHPRPSEMIRSLGLKDLAARGIDESAPIIAGHEPCGVVAEVGQGVDSKQFKVGDRVMVFHYEGCTHCSHCRTGWTQMCAEGALIHGFLAHGGHADYIKVPASSLVHLPEEMSFAGGAAVGCGTGTAYGALVRLNISARDKLAIFGLGPVGLSAAQLASAMGVEVFGVDVSAERVAQAREFGVAHVIDGSKVDPVAEILKLTGGIGVSCSMDCAGGEAARQQAVRCTRVWGKIALVAVGGSLVVDAMKDIIGKLRMVIGCYTFSELEMKDCAQFIADRGVEVDRLFTDRWSLDQAREAYQAFDRQSGGKGVILM